MKLLVTSGRGPAECRLAVVEIVRLIVAECGKLDLDVNVISGRRSSDDHGAASVVLVIEGEGAAEIGTSWIGTVQRIKQSTIRPNHKRKNWFVSVSELPDLEDPTELNLDDVSFSSFRASGPGGQHVNTTDSAVRAIHNPSGLVAVSRDGRSQHQNKKTAVARLAALLNIQAAVDKNTIAALVQSRHVGLERGNPVKVITT